jgi:hypothetical protein
MQEDRENSPGLFATGHGIEARLDYLNNEIPVLLVDGIYQDPQAVRDWALALPYGSDAHAFYPGRVARPPEAEASLVGFLRKVVRLVTDAYLPRLPVFPDGRRLSAIRGVDTDFAVADLHPDELHPAQRLPHTDAVPIFGLVYLNQEDRGGTLFFKPRPGGASSGQREGYPTDSDGAFELCGRIAGTFNRLAIYPGFMPHSGEMTGDWISSDSRFTAPRLTHRIRFFA